MEEMLMAANAAAGANPNPAATAPSSVTGGALRGGGGGGAPPVAGGAGPGTTERPGPAPKGEGAQLPRGATRRHQVLLLQQLQPPAAALLLQDVPALLDGGRLAPQRPVGGGSRKNKRSSSSAASASPASASTANSVVTSASMSMSMASTGGGASKNPKLVHEGAQDLNLAFPHHGGLQAPGEFPAFPSLESSSVCNPGGPMGTNGRGGGALSAMELLRSTGCYMPLQVPMQMPAEYATPGFALGEFRAPPPPPQSSQSLLGFSLDAHGSVGGPSAAGFGSSAGLQGVPESTGRLLFPFEDLKPTVSSGTGGGGASGGGAGVDGGHQFDHGKEQQAGGGGGGPGGHDTPGFWNGMIGGGSGTSWGIVKRRMKGRTRLGRKKEKWTPITMHASSEMSCLTIVPKPESSSHEKH
ncbi:hypothetical protein OsJ_15818 [Oryza sativa Japonica Group]|uniref:Uncharacterized protein n=1 Tax=Oryza sativa subsp. japonica TaxID=39947 RepID=A3AWI1_ORYSJ|nr:hypothetical protein OsJ_15818 [Oryza sativa Japonica Group]